MKNTLCYNATVLTHLIQFRGDNVVKIDYRDARPLHEQITQGIRELIICGAMSPGEALPSVRELAISLTVNPNTVQRAFKTLEAEGFIYSIRGRGSFVSERPDADRKTIKNLYLNLEEIVRELKFYGEHDEKIIEAAEKILE